MGCQISSDQVTPTSRQSNIPHIRFLDDIARYTNLNELRPTLVEESILDEEDLAADLGEAFNEHSKEDDRKEYLKRLFADPRGRDAFQRCVEKSVSRGSHHLGHDYILTLLDSTRPTFADEASIAMSKLLRKRMQGKMQMLVFSIKPSVLYVQMVEKRLLTLEEFETISRNKCTDIDNNKKIFALLKTKGPTAHLFFMQCLFESRKELPAHGEIHDILTKNDNCREISVTVSHTSTCTCLAPLSLLQVPECLKGKEYKIRRSKFDTYFNVGGDWLRESKRWIRSENPEMIVMGYLELAIGWLFQIKLFKAKKNLDLAGDVITSRVKNPAVLYARHEYLHALILRQQKQYQEARKQAEGARMILSLFEVSEDKAFGQYCYAIIFAEMLPPKSIDEDFQKAKEMLIAAIDYAKRAGDMEFLIRYALLHLARLNLGVTDEHLQVTSDPDRIQQAFRCLKELDSQLSLIKLNMRLESRYYLVKSDYHRSKGEMGLADETARRAEEMARKAKLLMDWQTANARIMHIQKIMEQRQKYCTVWTM